MPNILIIEDDPTLRKALTLVLAKRGHRVLQAADGGEGLRIAAAEPVDLVLTDLIMPNVEGLETIMALRAASPNLPVIAMSGGGRRSPKDYLHIAATMGAKRVFAKPFALEEVCDAIDGLLRTG